MQLQEFQAKSLLSQYAIAIPPGAIAATPDAAGAAAAQLKSDRIFVKAQIHAGDRLAAGGVRAVNSAQAAKAAAAELLGQKLVTTQTSAQGQIVRNVLIEAGLQVQQELYTSLQVDSIAGAIMLTAG